MDTTFTTSAHIVVAPYGGGNGCLRAAGARNVVVFAGRRTR
jgi:hypothetical protein